MIAAVPIRLAVMKASQVRIVPLPSPLSLRHTCAPAAWGRGRWPNHDWIDGHFTWAGREDNSLVWRKVEQISPEVVSITGTADPAGDAAWLAAILGAGQLMPEFADPVLQNLARQMPNLKPYAAGALYEGLVSSITGQSITVLAAAVTESRLARLFHPGLELEGRIYYPLPLPAELAGADPALIRSTGVTWRRAHALVAVAAMADRGELPDATMAVNEPELCRRLLRQLPLVGPWTAESAMLWGLGAPDAHPTRDVALLRAARQVYGQPTLTLDGLDKLAEGWSPYRGWAARLLWTELLGPAPLPSF